MAKRPSPELVKYIEKHLAKGFKIRHIKKKLAEVGHPIEAIEDAAAYVTASKSKDRKKIPKSMVVYGVILILIIAGFAWFIWFKATQQIEYEGKVEVIKKNATYKGMTDVELLKLAASRDFEEPCHFVRDHDMFYACLNKRWDDRPCYWRRLVGEDADDCYYGSAMESNDSNLCFFISDHEMALDCEYLIEKGVTYEEFFEAEEQESIENATSYMVQTQGRYLSDEPLPESEYMDACYGWDSSSNVACVMLAEKRGETGRLIEKYLRADSDDLSWQLHLAIYDVFRFLEGGEDCSSFTFDRSFDQDFFEQPENNITMEDVREMCRVIRSGDKAGCEGLEDVLFLACSAYFKDGVSECGDDYSCRLFVRAASFV